MNTIERTWPVDAFDAVSIWAPGIQLVIKSTSDDEVRLESQYSGQLLRDFKLEPADRWLQVHIWDEYFAQTPLILYLPEKKSWVVECSATEGKIEISNIQARLQVTLQKGDIRIMNCRGIFSIMSGDGHAELKNCSEASMPERPAVPHPWPDFQSPFGAEGNGRPRFFRNWRYWTTDDWSDWGFELGEKAHLWGEQLGQFIDHMGWMPHKAGVNLQMSKGDVRIEDLQANTCLIKISKGSATLERGLINELDAFLSHGDLECKSILPDGEWVIEANHGNIHLALPSDTQTRLDVATRQGDIHSEIPLVRVARPGPEARSGGRMVGTIGLVESISSQLNLAASHGNINIDLQREKGPYPRKPAQAEQAPAQAEQPTPQAVHSNPEPGAAQAVQAQPGVETNPPAVETAQAEADPQLAILQALHDGTISVDEAEQLLIKLGA